jgi:hypothetical protein
MVRMFRAQCQQSLPHRNRYPMLQHCIARCVCVPCAPYSCVPVKGRVRLGLVDAGNGDEATSPFVEIWLPNLGRASSRTLCQSQSSSGFAHTSHPCAHPRAPLFKLFGIIARVSSCRDARVSVRTVAAGSTSATSLCSRERISAAYSVRKP